MKKKYQQPQVAVEQVETQQATMLLSSSTAPETAPQRDGFVPGGGVLGGKK